MVQKVLAGIDLVPKASLAAYVMRLAGMVNLDAVRYVACLPTHTLYTMVPLCVWRANHLFLSSLLLGAWLQSVLEGCVPPRIIG